ncbi:sigma factor-like helix-turn-helix DNA-binding protein [Massilia sp. BKSP1R2A-1]|uniref:sigma factor-like helix-turn-helix DNA-binding protein n=1 Tax=Massilia sp. BKSP1R2A-1 TaxID=3422595 RepID=UPI003D33E413
MKPVPRPVLRVDEIHQQLGELTRQLTSNPDVARFSLQVDNRTGMVFADVHHHDGQIQHNEWIAGGRSQNTRLAAPHTIDERNNSVLSLLDQGLTQMEVARRIGISQSRVAQIKKSSST